MLNFFRHWTFLGSGHRRRLFVAGCVPERLRSRESLLKSSPADPWVFIGGALVFSGLLLAFRLVFPDLAILYLLFATAVLLFVIYSGAYPIGVYGDSRSRYLRYAFYVARPEFEDRRQRAAILALDGYYRRDQGCARPFSYLSIFLGALLGLGIAGCVTALFIAWFGYVPDGLFVFVCGSVPALVFSCRRWAWTRAIRQYVKLCGQPDLDSRLLALVEQAYARYPVPSVRKSRAPKLSGSAR